MKRLGRAGDQQDRMPPEPSMQLQSVCAADCLRAVPCQESCQKPVFLGRLSLMAIPRDLAEHPGNVTVCGLIADCLGSLQPIRSQTLYPAELRAHPEERKNRSGIPIDPQDPQTPFLPP